MLEVASQLIEALRHELHEYGGLLALLDHSPESGTCPVADQAPRSAAALSDQADRLREACRRRERCQRKAAQLLPPSAEPSFEGLLAMLPAPYRFAVTELVRENHDLRARVQHRARENQRLLRHSLELMEQFIARLTAGERPAASAGNGPPESQAEPPLTDYRAVG